MRAEDTRVSELVMVIEDEKEISDLIRYNLERAGFRVAASADGEEGLQRLFESRADAVVLDLMLPGRSGLEVLREIRDEPTTRDLPVVVLTARSAEMDKLLGFEHGADDYVTKPFSPRELVARLRALLRRAKPDRGEGTVTAGELVVDARARDARLTVPVAHASIISADRDHDLVPVRLSRSRIAVAERVADFHFEQLHGAPPSPTPPGRYGQCKHSQRTAVTSLTGCGAHISRQAPIIGELRVESHPTSPTRAKSTIKPLTPGPRGLRQPAVAPLRRLPRPFS
jgi:CheY-like chemotaxis protein